MPAPPSWATGAWRSFWTSWGSASCPAWCRNRASSPKWIPSRRTARTATARRSCCSGPARSKDWRCPCLWWRGWRSSQNPRSSTPADSDVVQYRGKILSLASLTPILQDRGRSRRVPGPGAGGGLQQRRAQHRNPGGPDSGHRPGDRRGTPSLRSARECWVRP